MGAEAKDRRGGGRRVGQGPSAGQGEGSALSCLMPRWRSGSRAAQRPFFPRPGLGRGSSGAVLLWRLPPTLSGAGDPLSPPKTRLAAGPAHRLRPSLGREAQGGAGGAAAEGAAGRASWWRTSYPAGPDHNRRLLLWAPAASSGQGRTRSAAGESAVRAVPGAAGEERLLLLGRALSRGRCPAPSPPPAGIQPPLSGAPQEKRRMN